MSRRRREDLSAFEDVDTGARSRRALRVQLLCRACKQYLGQVFVDELPDGTPLAWMPSVQPHWVPAMAEDFREKDRRFTIECTNGHRPTVRSGVLAQRATNAFLAGDRGSVDLEV